MSTETFQPTSFSQAAYLATREWSHSESKGEQAIAEALRDYGKCLDNIVAKSADVAKGAADIRDAVARGADPIDWIASSAAEVAQLIARRRALVEAIGHLCYALDVDADSLIAKVNQGYSL